MGGIVLGGGNPIQQGSITRGPVDHHRAIGDLKDQIVDAFQTGCIQVKLQSKVNLTAGTAAPAVLITAFLWSPWMQQSITGHQL